MAAENIPPFYNQGWWYASTLVCSMYNLCDGTYPAWLTGQIAYRIDYASATNPDFQIGRRAYYLATSRLHALVAKALAPC